MQAATINTIKYVVLREMHCISLLCARQRVHYSLKQHTLWFRTSVECVHQTCIYSDGNQASAHIWNAVTDENNASTLAAKVL